MVERNHTLIAILLAACVLFVFVSPALNLPYTTVNGRQHPTHPLLALAMLQVCLAALAFAAIRVFFSACRFLFDRPAESVTDIICVRRC